MTDQSPTVPDTATIGSMKTRSSARGARPAARWAGVTLVLIGALSGCAAGYESPTEGRTVTLPGPAGERSAIVYHPSSAAPGAPLVIVSHGANGTGGQTRRSLGWDDLAERDGFVVAYPDALDGTWEAGLCCRPADSPPVDDVAFLHELRELLITDDGVDPSRVYAVGASNGGMLSYAWACQRPDDLIAIGVVAAALSVPCPTPEPITVVAVHGTADTLVPIDGGGSVFPSLEDSLAPFRAAAACPSEPVVDSGPAATVTTWNCADGTTVVQDVVEGAEHGWPGVGGRAGTDEGPTDSTGFLWSRLKAVPTR